MPQVLVFPLSPRTETVAPVVVPGDGNYVQVASVPVGGYVHASVLLTVAGNALTGLRVEGVQNGKVQWSRQSDATNDYIAADTSRITSLSGGSDWAALSVDDHNININLTFDRLVFYARAGAAASVSMEVGLSLERMPVDARGISTPGGGLSLAETVTAFTDSLKASLTGGAANSVFALLTDLRPKSPSKPELFNVIATNAFAALPAWPNSTVVRIKNLNPDAVEFRFAGKTATSTILGNSWQDVPVDANANEIEVKRIDSATADLSIEIEAYGLRVV